MFLWDLIVLLAIAFIIFVASCVGAIIIMLFILLIEWADSVSKSIQTFYRFKKGEKDKGSGN